MLSLAARDFTRPEHKPVDWPLVEGRRFLLGRKVSGDQLLIDWDPQIAECHATVQLQPNGLHVHSWADGDQRQPIFYDGRRSDEFVLVPGEGFVIGRTAFQFAPRGVAGSTPASHGDSPSSSGSDAFAKIQDLLKVPLGPGLNLADFHQRLVAALKEQVARADLVEILHVKPDEIQTLARSGELGICSPFIRHVMRRQHAGEIGWSAGSSAEFPRIADAAWAYCVPVICDMQEYAIYVSGKTEPRVKATAETVIGAGLRDDEVAFINIVANILQSAQAITDLKRCRDDMEAFFPKQIRNLLRRQGSKEVFRLDEAKAAILFCDLRGSSRFAEQRADKLDDAWKGIQEALSMMTVAITGQNGTIGDFQGDAAMAFWGWPRRSGDLDRLPEDVTHACQAADKLREQFFQKFRESELKCGIGIAAGDVVAGMLGTREQRKIGVFGPAVNLAARLESMTKQLGVSITIDERAQEALRRDKSERASDLADRLRFLAAIQPAGMDAAVRVYELLPPPSDTSTPFNIVRLFEVGREAFERGDWGPAKKDLTRVAGAGDGPAKFLLKHMEQLGAPPANWDGRVVLASK